ncbi:homoserine dehydrogenase [Bacillus sp. FJAT-18017]|uniref:homoserine dehydrogenase n=1 Tax=Bacillus sp. FJAT-18017 TaxID=1705566 RepID=UPI0006AFD9FB|nr:homoserine dehydrogenase [Bacillus sp. FJAT-18017]ALC90322.1 homoserine dehydrogenase [Bacillus sp. FJAT-18017]
MDKILVGLLGYGTVGTGVKKIIEDHQDKLRHQVGCPVIINKILVKDLQKHSQDPIDQSLFTTDASEIIHNPEIDIVIEVMGGMEETKAMLLDALNRKKHVVTANKDLMAVYGAELLTAAHKNNCDLFYEASVAGGIPILRSLVDGLASDRITKMMGIVNGTTNFILTKMSKEGLPFDLVLKEAQEKGYAESNPAADVEGLDAARKMVILATLGFSMKIDLEDVNVSGITSVTQEDIKYGKQLGYTMKLIGYAHRQGDKVEVSVQPTFITDSHPLASVQNENNAVFVCGEAVGETMFYGPGAGSLPTATSIVSDLVEVIKNLRLGVNGRSAVIPQFTKKLKTDDEKFSKYFLRLKTRDKVGVFAEIASIFSKHEVSFQKILQMPTTQKEKVDLVVVTHLASSKSISDLKDALLSVPEVEEIKSFYRVEGVSI